MTPYTLTGTKKTTLGRKKDYIPFKKAVKSIEASQYGYLVNVWS